MPASVNRDVVEVLVGQAASDGDGVKLKRIFGGSRAERFDPFLMLDEFGSDDAADYVGGFPSHPHRGFETVTYMLEGRMLHEDHMGNRGLLEPGGVQWMTAGKGIIHSEMPQQDSGRMRGFQLWVNLPSAEKMQPASYQDLPSSAVTEQTLPSGGTLRLIAGELELAGGLRKGPINGKSTEPLYLDLHLVPDERVELPVSVHLNAMLYVYEGQIVLHGREQTSPLGAGLLGRLGSGNRIALSAGKNGARLLLIAGKPLGEPIVQYGPFVMNSREEIEQALRDYRDGRLAG
ncbi:pirin family protein [Halopseudomonas pelagia]|uniref:pirin family protein n=1 Tax=Halopseudomonas pelagia TaxID=553151 RepID=UPI0003A53519|nr:pirin family protein [Halopseudomonas pelagia]|tara:strand:- start:1133 stop:2002 length:870 start_codon:yes stop_codon:yes gene_type:complete